MNKTAVVILNWNGRDLMRKYLPSVIATSHATGGVDVIVADNASTDGSVEMLKSEFPSVGIIALDRNYGFAEGYNRALAQIGHSYVVLLNSDVATTEGWLQPLVSLMDSDPTVGACGPKLLDDKDHSRFEYAGAAGGYLDAYGFPFCRGRILDNVEADNGQYDDNADCLWVSGAALMTRRELYLSLGGLDTDFFAHMEEIDLCWRMRNKGWRIVAVTNGAKVFHLGGATLAQGNPRKTFLNFRNNLTMLVKNLNNKTWWLTLVIRMNIDSIALLRFLAGGEVRQSWAVLKAHIGFWWQIRKSLRKRATLKVGRSHEVVPEVRTYSMIWRRYAHKLNTFNTIDK
ncbi:MAG: glycosyltransferase family 2 protein [Bacteroidales bacterium]|nr:glycosyltransferase family 2 protein [Bacteroidales bacterium]